MTETVDRERKTTLRVVVSAVGAVLHELLGNPLLRRKLVRQSRRVILHFLEDAQQISAHKFLYIGRGPSTVSGQLGQQQGVTGNVWQFRRWPE